MRAAQRLWVIQAVGEKCVGRALVDGHGSALVLPAVYDWVVAAASASEALARVEEHVGEHPLDFELKHWSATPLNHGEELL